MDKYIKVSDLMKLINNQQKEIKEDYDKDRICFSSKIAMDGTLEVLRKEITGGTII